MKTIITERNGTLAMTERLHILTDAANEYILFGNDGPDAVAFYAEECAPIVHTEIARFPRGGSVSATEAIELIKLGMRREFPHTQFALEC